MAAVSLQAESARANAPRPSLHSAAMVLEALSDDLAELSALVLLASQSAHAAETERMAFRAIVTRLDLLAAKAEAESDALVGVAP